MKLTYIANIRIPTEKAHGRQIMEMCNAFVEQGVDLELLTARRLNPQFKNTDPFEYYDIKNKFPIRKAANIDLTPLEMNKVWGRFGVFIQCFSFAFFAFLWTVLDDADIIYSRDPHPLFFLSFFKNNLVYEIHKVPNNFLVAYKFLFRRVKKVVVITEKIKNNLVEKLGVDEEKILVEPDGVDVSKFDIKDDKYHWREQLGLPQNKNIILYSGHLFAWKGVYVLANVAKYLDSSHLVIFLGGMRYDIEDLKKYAESKKINNLLFVGYKDPEYIPKYLKAADVLVLPNSGEKAVSKLYTSPMKMFEYMAARRLIVAADLPSLREVLNSENSYLFEADNPQDLADKIKDALRDKEKSSRIVEKAFEDVGQYEWEKRAKKIMDFIRF